MVASSTTNFIFDSFPKRSLHIKNVRHMHALRFISAPQKHFTPKIVDPPKIVVPNISWLPKIIVQQNCWPPNLFLTTQILCPKHFLLHPPPSNCLSQNCFDPKKILPKHLYTTINFVAPFSYFYIKVSLHAKIQNPI